jgi:hypothetical protein
MSMIVVHPGLNRAMGRVVVLTLICAPPALCAEPASSSAVRPVIQALNVRSLQTETGQSGKGPYDWGPSIMRDGPIYKLWWVRLGGAGKQSFPYATTLPSGERFEFTYPDHGDRVYYAESADGRTWHLTGPEYTGPADRFGPDAPGPMMVLAPANSPHERMHLACPTVVKVKGVYYLYYEACSEFKVAKGADGKITVGDEYHNQVFVATSPDGRQWHKYPDDHDPQPIIRTPDSNKQYDRRRYGLGQPSVFYRNGRYVLHYVDSCTGPGDFIVRIESGDPFFKNPRVFRDSLAKFTGDPRIPSGAVARFAGTDVRYLGDTLYLLRAAWGTGNLGLLASKSGLFASDAQARTPADVFPQISLEDPRGPQYRERLFPRFLSDPEGGILVENGRVTIFCTLGLGFKESADTWDLARCEIPLERLRKISD